MEKVRVIFSRTGAAKYLAHLDVARMMSRAVSRAKLPIWYTEGFNPRPHLVFGPPLPVGCESTSELMEFKIDQTRQKMSVEAMVQRLSKELIGDIAILSAIADPHRRLGEIAYASYQFSLYYSTSTTIKIRINEISQIFQKILSEPALIGAKRTKKGTKIINLVPLIHSSKICSDTVDRSVKINATLSASSEKYLSPDLFIKTVLSRIEDIAPDFISTTRRAFYDKNFLLFP